MSILSMVPRSSFIVRKLFVEVEKFYSENYSANLMTAVILSHDPVEKLIGLAEDYFGGILNKDLPKPSWPDTPWLAGCHGSFVQVYKYYGINNLMMLWHIPQANAGAASDVLAE